MVPQQIRPLILEELHQGLGSGHLGQEKTLVVSKNGFTGLVTFVMYTIGVSTASAVLLDRLLPLDEELPLGILLLGTPCRS